MSYINELFNDLNLKQKRHHETQGVILSFQEFLELFADFPKSMTRDSASYIKDMFDFFGTREPDNNCIADIRYKLFDLGTEAGTPVIGGEDVQKEIFNTLTYFQRQGAASKLIVLHGPNGSSKSSTVDSISHAMQRYSRCPEGAVYRFNWIFPTDKSTTPTAAGESGPIGFGADTSYTNGNVSYAKTDESKISSKIISEYKENPIFLIPMPYREELLKKAISKKHAISESDVTLPPHILKNGLSKKNQEIFENLLNAYEGDIQKVFRHVQVERFYYSKQYRVGISTVEPQMRLDAGEKQLTMDKSISNIPSVLQTISFYQAQGELIEANRGLLEFSDLLKRPVEAFKYLLATIEKGSINLPSSSPLLDVTFMATTNEKHLDAFKQMPDFSSFKGRIELVNVPYLLQVSEEIKIYCKDIDSIIETTAIAPHALETLCTWAVMTRLKQPDANNFNADKKTLLLKLTPIIKAKIYDGKPIPEDLSVDDRDALMNMKNELIRESKGMVIYEGRFGASPREIRGLIHKAVQTCGKNTLSALDIFNELRELTKDKTLYEYLQFEPRAGFHDAIGFIKVLEKEYCDVFRHELLDSMSMVETREYDKLLKRYIDHSVAQIKKEKILDPSTGQYIEFSESILGEVEKIIGITSNALDFRKSILSRLASWKIDNPKKDLIIADLFDDLHRKIKNHFFKQREKGVTEICNAMLMLKSEGPSKLTNGEQEKAESTFKNLSNKYGYNEHTALESLKFLMKNK
jgi:serine protein kinase